MGRRANKLRKGERERFIAWNIIFFARFLVDGYKFHWTIIEYYDRVKHFS